MPDDENDAKLRGTVWALVVVVTLKYVFLIMRAVRRSRAQQANEYTPSRSSQG